MTSLPSLKQYNYPTLTKFVFAEENNVWHTASLPQLLNCIQIIAKSISSMLRRIGLSHLFGCSSTNHEPKTLQHLSYEIFVDSLSTLPSVGILVSPEAKHVIQVNHKGKFIITFDPLDGTSNIDCCIPVGSMFAVSVKENEAYPTTDDATNPKNKMVAAGYAMYGTATVLVLSVGHGVSEFILDPQIGDFLLSARNIKIPKRGRTFSVNEGYERDWDQAVKEYIMQKKLPSDGTPYSGRYVGSMVADIHRTIKQGGIFMYPLRKGDNGKLRVLCECQPMAFIVTQAGGLATDGTTDILQVKTQNINQRTQIFLGSKEDVEELMSFINKHRKREDK